MQKKKAHSSRKGGRSVSDLLKVLFLYACSDLSFRILAAAAFTLGISSISEAAWRKRFSRAVPFLHSLLHSMLSDLFKPTSAPAGLKDAYLVDGSAVRQQGAEQNLQRIHLCYSLNQNRMSQLKVTDRHTAESLSHFSMKKGDLFMSDAGYGTAQNYIYAQEHHSDVILRITPKNFCLYDAEGQKIPLTSMLEKAVRHDQDMVDMQETQNMQKRWCFCSLSYVLLQNGSPSAGNVSLKKKKKTWKMSIQYTKNVE